MPITDKKIYSDDFISLDHDSHIYTDKQGNQYQSMSKLLSIMEVPFDRDGMSMNIAKRNVGRGASSKKLVAEQKKILKQWDQKRDNSISHGNNIHDGLEKYFLIGKSGDGDIDVLGSRIYNEFAAPFHRSIPEKIYYNTNHMLAGTGDLSVVRKQNTSKPWILDLYDYKSNIEQGIRFDSIDRRKSPPRHYEQYYVNEFSHVESCNYYKYSMQLTGYAYMAMHLYNVRIGRLAIIFIDENLNYQPIPVPFMYYEFEKLLEMNGALKKLPEIKKKEIAQSTEDDSRVVFDMYNDHYL